MGEVFFNLGRIARLIGVALLVMVTNIAVSVLYMVVYSYLIDPGHEKEYYDAHIQVAAPYCSIIAGIPLMFLAGWWVGGWVMTGQAHEDHRSASTAVVAMVVSGGRGRSGLVPRRRCPRGAGVMRAMATPACG